MNLHILFYLFVFLISACGGGTTQVNSVYKATLEVYLIDQDAFQLNWQDANNATYYQVLKRNPDGASFRQVGSDIAAGKQSDGETYYFSTESDSEFQLKSCNAQSCKTSSILSIKSPPTLTAMMDDSEILQFNWIDASYATHYKVWVKYAGDSDFTLLSPDIMAGEQSYQIATALPELQDAQFQLETCNASGCIATFAGGLVAAPLQLSFNAPLVDNEFYLTWDDVAYASDYKLYKKTSAKADFTLIEDNIPTGQQRHAQLFDASEENQSQFKLASCNASGCLTATVTVVTAMPSFASTDQQAIKFIWQEVDYATHYQLWAERNIGSGWQKISEDIAVGGEQYHYTVSDLADHAQTRFVLKSCNSSGCNASTPISLEASALAIRYQAAGQFHFDWPSTAFATHYQLFENPDARALKTLVKSAGDSFSIVVSDIPAGTQSIDYHVTLAERTHAQYLLKSCNAAGCLASAPVSVAIETAALNPVAFATDTYQLSWTDVGSATYYQLWEDPDGVSGFSPVGGDVPAGTESIDHPVVLADRTQAQYQLYSCNAVGCLPSAPVSVAIQTAALNPVAFATDTYQLSWTDVGSATHYQLWEDPDGVSGFSPVGGDVPAGTESIDHPVVLADRTQAHYQLYSCNAVGCLPSAPVSVAIQTAALNPVAFAKDTYQLSWTDVGSATHYQLWEDPDGVSGFSPVGGDVPAGTESIDHAVVLADRTQAQYQLYSCNAVGCLPSAPVSVAIQTAALNPVAFATDTYQLSWTDVGSATHYQLWEDPDGVSGFSPVGGDVPAGTESIDHPVVLADRTQAHYQLYSCNAVGCLPSAPVSVAIQTAALNPVAFAPDTYQLSWTDVASATHYQLWEDPDGVSGFSPVGGDVPAGTESIDHAVVLADRTHAQYQLYSCNSVGCLPSAPVAVSFTTAQPSIEFGTNTYLIRWTDRVGALHYQVEEDPDGVSGFALVSGDILPDEQQYEPTVNPADRPDAHYKLNTCYVVGCIPSSVVIANGFRPAELNLVFANDKTFAFNWVDSNHVNYYQLLENSDGSSGFTQVGGDIVLGVEAYDHIVPLYARTNAQYVLNSCNALGCLSSATISVANTMVNSISYMKASNAETGDNFGTAIALSDDGSVLVIGASGEDGQAVGINGDASDNNESNAGAVYVFTRQSEGWVEQAYIKASNSEAGDNFGSAVALNDEGDLLAVGAAGEDSSAQGVNGDTGNNSASNAGAIYIFQRSGDVWSESAYIKASNSEAGDYFGSEVSLSDDGMTLAVSARHEDSASVGINGDGSNNLANKAGAVYIFQRSGVVWAEQAYIKPSNTDDEDMFGSTVQLSANGLYLVVGAIYERSNAVGVNGDETNNSSLYSGAAYVFSLTGDVWLQQAYLKASNNHSRMFFAYALAINATGDLIAISALNENNGAQGIDGDQYHSSASNAGAVYLFSRQGSAWHQAHYIKSSNSQGGDNFGTAMSLSSDGQWLAVGAAVEESTASGINSNQADDSGTVIGAVYMFQKTASSWQQVAYVKAANPDSVDFFGSELSISADGLTLAVGARLEDGASTVINQGLNNNDAENAGAVYLY